MDETLENLVSGPLFLKCPGCQQRTTSLKRFGILQQVVFVGIYAQARSGPFVACPRCMRKELLRNAFSIKHILLGNLMWLLALLPYNLAMMLVTLVPGHSKVIRDRIAEKIREAESQA